jgi:DNA polymerase-3 subunit beta
MLSKRWWYSSAKLSISSFTMCTNLVRFSVVKTCSFILSITKPSSLILDTELIRYKWVSYGGNFPEWQKLVPTEFNTVAHFDTVEAIKAVNSLKALSDNPKAYPIDLTIGDGKLVMANPDDKGQTELVADTDGQGSVRIDGKYLAEALKACGGILSQA